MSGGSSLRAAMKKKAASAERDETQDQVAAELAIADQPAPLRVAPAPVDDEPLDQPVGEGSGDTATDAPVVETTDEAAGQAGETGTDSQPEPEPDTEVVPSSDPDPIHVDPVPDGEPGASPQSDEPAARQQTAQVLASGLSTAPATVDEPAKPAAKKTTATRKKTASQDPAQESAPAAPDEPSVPELSHLTRVMRGGRDQRRYVSDYLPPRTGRGTNVRLPIHLQDVLAEYCDRDTAPMADLIAAVLDGYFRDLGALPPLGEGNHPRKEFFDELRAQTTRRSYDY